MDGSGRRVDGWRIGGLVVGLVIWGLFPAATALVVAALYALTAVLLGLVTRRQAEWTRHGLAAAGVAVVLTVIEWLIS